MKELFKGIFNFSSQMETRYAYAHSGRQAKIFMMRQMAIDHDVSYQTVFHLFDGSKPNFEIKKETI